MADWYEGLGITKPYYGDSAVCILHGDCRDILPTLPDNSVDLVLTDPPYNISFGKYKSYTDDLEAKEYIAMLSLFNPFAVVIMQYPEEMMRYVIPALGIPDEVMAWVYASDLPNRNFRLINFYRIQPDYLRVRQPYRWPRDKRTAKLIANGSDGAKHYDWISDIPIVRNISPEKTEHPCPVPEALVSRLINLTAENNATILDPFLGSGTTAYCAKKLNRKCIGIEIEEKYCEIAANRCRQSVMELNI